MIMKRIYTNGSYTFEITMKYLYAKGVYFGKFPFKESYFKWDNMGNIQTVLTSFWIHGHVFRKFKKKFLAKTVYIILNNT